MHPDEFTPESAGRVVRATQGHWTFIPNPLPPKLTFDLELVQAFSKAERALGELAGVGRMLPNPTLLIRPFISREAVLSSQIEGTVTRLGQLLLFEAEPNDFKHPADANEVLNYVKAVEFGLNAIRSGYPFSWGLIEEVHRVLMNDVRGGEMRPGQLRDRPVLLGRSGQSFEQARFVPPCHTQLRPLVDDFVKFIREDRSLPLLALLAVSHYQFETIHPFNDGNGRVGRLLFTLLLCERGVLPEPLLYLSAFFERNRQEYYDHLLSVSRNGEWSAWMFFVAHGVAEQAADATTRSRLLLQLWRSYQQRATEAVRSPATLLIVDEVFRSPYISSSRVAEVAKVSRVAAQKTIAKLVEAGLLREITGQARYRMYCADEVLRYLDAPLSELPTSIDQNRDHE
jgi:Fic family protein